MSLKKGSTAVRAATFACEVVLAYDLRDKLSKPNMMIDHARNVLCSLGVVRTCCGGQSNNWLQPPLVPVSSVCPQDMRTTVFATTWQVSWPNLLDPFAEIPRKELLGHEKNLLRTLGNDRSWPCLAFSFEACSSQQTACSFTHARNERDATIHESVESPIKSDQKAGTTALDCIFCSSTRS